MLALLSAAPVAAENVTPAAAPAAEAALPAGDPATPGESGVAGSEASEDEREYREVLDHALREFEAGHWPEALGLFRRAHALHATARTHRALGLVLYEMRSYAACIEHLEAALGDPRRPLTPEQRSQADKILLDARSFVARFQVQVEPATAELLVDGQLVPTPEPASATRALVLDAGKHTLTARAPGQAPVSRQIVATPGQSGTLRLSLGGDREAMAGPQSGPDRTAVWIAAGVAGSALITGTVFAFLGDAAYDDVRTACAEGACDAAQVREEIDDSGGETHDTVAQVALGLGAAAAVTALVLYVMADGEGAAPEATPAGTTASSSPTGLTVGWSPVGVAVGGRF